MSQCLVVTRLGVLHYMCRALPVHELPTRWHMQSLSSYVKVWKSCLAVMLYRAGRRRIFNLWLEKRLMYVGGNAIPCQSFR